MTTGHLTNRWKANSESFRERAGPIEMRSAYLPRHPAVAYLFFFRGTVCEDDRHI